MKMKAELRLSNHSVLPGQKIIEIWFDGEFVGQVAGAEGPGIRVLSKHQLEAELRAGGVNVVEVRVVAPAPPVAPPRESP